MKPFSFHTAGTTKDALKLLGKYRGRAVVLAGGSDLIPQMKAGRKTPEAVIDIKSIRPLNGIRMSGKNAVSIGPLTTLSEIESDPIIRKKLPVLSLTASLMASPQVRNRGTIGGNLANAAPSADMAPPLIALGARVQVISRRGTKTLPLEKFFIGPGQTLLGRSDLLGRITVPVPPKRGRVTYEPLCLREAMDISIASAAVYIERVRSKITLVRIVLGSVAPVPLMVIEAGKALVGTSGDTGVDEAASIAADFARPISDVRGSKVYRKKMVRVLVARALRKVLA